MKDDLIQRVADKVLQDAIDRDPVVYYEFVRGMKLSDWQKLHLREQQRRTIGNYMMINGQIHVRVETKREIYYEPLTFGETQ